MPSCICLNVISIHIHITVLAFVWDVCVYRVFYYSALSEGSHFLRRKSRVTARAHLEMLRCFEMQIFGMRLFLSWVLQLRIRFVYSVCVVNLCELCRCVSTYYVISLYLPTRRDEIDPDGLNALTQSLFVSVVGPTT